MSLILELDTRLAWLNKSASRPVLHTLASQLNQVLQSSLQHCTPPRRLYEVLMLDLIYATLRNKKWLDVPLFRDALADHIATEFALARQIADDVVSNFCDQFRRLYPRGELQVDSDKDFLRYLYYLRCCNSDLAAPVDLGFGNAIFVKLDNAIKMTEQLESEDTMSEACFLPSIDSSFVEIVIDLKDELKQNPNQLAHMQLQLSCSELEAYEKVLIHELGQDRLLSLLILIGKDRTKSIGDVQSCYSDIDQAVWQPLFVALKSAGLVFMVNPHVRFERTTWSLSELGYRLTASAFARHCPLAPIDSIKGLPAMYQAEVLTNLNTKGLEDIHALGYKWISELSSEGLTALLMVMTQHSGIDATVVWVRSGLEQQQLSHSAKKSCLRFLTLHAQRQDVRLIFKSMAEFNASPVLQDLAIEGLVLGEQTPDVVPTIRKFSPAMPTPSAQP